MKCSNPRCDKDSLPKTFHKGPSPRYCSKRCMSAVWRQKDPGYYARRLWERKSRWVNYLGGCCVECGESRLPCLDFDHIDSATKLNEVCSMIRSANKYPEDVIEAEVKKCQLLCSNCHRIKSAKNWVNYCKN